MLLERLGRLLGISMLRIFSMSFSEIFASENDIPDLDDLLFYSAYCYEIHDYSMQSQVTPTTKLLSMYMSLPGSEEIQVDFSYPKDLPYHKPGAVRPGSVREHSVGDSFVCELKRLSSTNSPSSLLLGIL